jgi:hypothetical protein
VQHRTIGMYRHVSRGQVAADAAAALLRPPRGRLRPPSAASRRGRPARGDLRPREWRRLGPGADGRAPEPTFHNAASGTHECHHAVLRV